MDSRILAEIPDDYLADLQSKFDQKSAVYIRAQQEWQRRLTRTVVRSSIWASVIGGVLGIIGAIVGVLIGWWIAHPYRGRNGGEEKEAKKATGLGLRGQGRQDAGRRPARPGC